MPALLTMEKQISASENEEFRQFIAGARVAPYLAVDTETNGAPEDGYDIRDGRGYLTGLSTAYRIPGLPTSARYFPFRHGGLATRSNLPQDYLYELKNLIENHPCLIFQNAKHDIVSLKTIGINVTGKFYDTVLLAHWTNENRPSKRLDSLAWELLKRRKGNDEAFKQALKVFGWANLPVEVAGPYAALDAELTLEVFEKLYPDFVAQEFDTELWTIEQDFTHVLIAMEAPGTKVNLPLATEQAAEGRARMAEIHESLGYNPGSNKDLEFLLLGELGLPIIKTSFKTGKPSFDKWAMAQYEEMLQGVNSPVASQILAYRGWQKATSSYWDNYLRLVSPDGRIRPQYKMAGTVTGRLSCEKPNLQQIPRVGEKDWNKLTKKGFIPEEGFGLWEADYAQLEFRLGAAYAYQHDPDSMQPLLDAFADPNRDVFGEMAEQLGFTRFDTKTLTYTIQYGGGASRISNVFGVNLDAGKRIRDQWFDTYEGFKQVSRLAAARCRSQNYLKLWSGRRRHFFDPENEAHKAFNSAIQGGAAEIVKRALIRLYRELSSSECKFLLQVHDSVVAEIATGRESEYGPEIQRIMSDVKPDFGVTFRADFHKWGE